MNMKKKCDGPSKISTITSSISVFVLLANFLMYFLNIKEKILENITKIITINTATKYSLLKKFTIFNFVKKGSYKNVTVYGPTGSRTQSFPSEAGYFIH